MRLINADYLRSIYSITHAHFDSIESIRQWIDKVPTVDATPVRHGHWTHERLVSTSGGTYAVVRCSECKWQHPMLETKFCPNCGAKMEAYDETD